MSHKGIKGRGTHEKISTSRINKRSLKGAITTIITICVVATW